MRSSHSRWGQGGWDSALIAERPSLGMRVLLEELGVRLGCWLPHDAFERGPVCTFA